MLKTSALALHPLPANTHIDQLQSRLLSLAAVFLSLNALGLSISPVVSARNWQAGVLWQHWFGLLVWLAGFLIIHALSKKYLPQRDPYIIPIAGLLCGWGLMTVWRLYPDLGLRQSFWLMISIGIVGIGIRFTTQAFLIRKYKYTWLIGSLILTALTFIWGTNPMGYGPEMWLGCCGIYLQPSEPLKFMLIAYLAAYLADQQPFLLLSTMKPAHAGAKRISSGNYPIGAGLFPLLAPTLIMSGMALLLLVIQQDLGTATIFLLLYATIIYVATGDFRVIWLSIIGLLIAFVGGYRLFEIVQIRVEAWLNPFLDPSGNSYQIVQSLIAFANGEIFGRGLGIGYPNLVPVAHSDFIFTSIVEEQGFLGGMALISCLVILFYRGIRAALKTSDSYRRFLGIGLTAYLIGQSILIIGGNLRLLPLTGITLPFMSYGGSSLVVSFLSLLFLVLISQNDEEQRAPIPDPRVYRNVGTAFLAMFIFIGLLIGWWTLYRSAEMLNRTDNPRRTISDTYVRRGSILDRQNIPITETTGQPGSYTRVLNVPTLSNIIGYTNPTYGQSGLEASMDEFLRGDEGNPPGLVWWNRLVYGFPPTGRDIRTSIEIKLQAKMDGYLQPFTGAAILVNAQTGEILAMSSRPTFDGNQLDTLWKDLINDQDAPLLNRVVQGLYPLGKLSDGVFRQSLESGGISPNPQIRLPADQLLTPQTELMFASPLQIVLLSAAISNRGLQPAPLLVTAVNLEPDGWIILPPIDRPLQLFSAIMANFLGTEYEIPELSIWQDSQVVEKPAGGSVTWFVGGTSPGWEGIPYGITILLESDNLNAATEIGQSLLMDAMQP